MIENVLGRRLAKEHSAADWSRRPLPEPWLRYAALDVEVLIDLRDALERELRAQGKLGFAHEEFEAILSTPPAEPRPDPWRRTSGMHRIRTRRQLAIVRELWNTRDEQARARDIAPGRVLADSAIVAAALASPAAPEELGHVPGWSGRGARRLVPVMWPAIRMALELPGTDLPLPSLPSDGPPQPGRWAERDPVAAARLAAARVVLAATADEHQLRVENLLPPDGVRRLCWSPPDELTKATVASALRAEALRTAEAGQAHTQ